jgi:hypothetical protein
MRRVRPPGLFGDHSLPIVQMGSQNRSAGQRDGCAAEGELPRSFRPLSAPIQRLPIPRLVSDILVPQFGMRTDEFAHNANTFLIVENRDADPMFLQEILSAPEVAILSNDNAGDSKEQRSAGAHDAGAKSADESQLRPVPSSARIAQANYFGMRCRISTLNSQVVAPGNDLPVLVRQNRTDGQASLAQSIPRLFESLL